MKCEKLRRQTPIARGRAKIACTTQKYCRVERHVYTQAVASVSNPTKPVGLVQSGHHYHLIEQSQLFFFWFQNVWLQGVFPKNRSKVFHDIYQQVGIQTFWNQIATQLRM